MKQRNKEVEHLINETEKKTMKKKQSGGERLLQRMYVKVTCAL